MADAGCTIVGGHTIDDPEPKYGFAVTGLIDPAAIIANGNAAIGDVLVLTKPLGTGIVATAIKRDGCPDDVARAAIDWMTMLNRDAARTAVEVGVRAGTDVTGFGLLGHLSEITVASGVGAVIDWSDVPLIEGATELEAAGFYPGGSERNVEAVQPLLSANDAGSAAVRILADAQTSGGLLLCVNPDRVHELLSGLDHAWVIGKITEGDGTIEIR
jgi:selenide,water dikinase